RQVYPLRRRLPLALGAVTLAMLPLGHLLWAMAVAMTIWGALNAAIPVSWSAWLAQGIGDEPESGGGLMVAAIQLSIMLGAALGGLLLDHISVAATFIGGTVLLVLASVTVGNGNRVAGADGRQ